MDDSVGGGEGACSMSRQHYICVMMMIVNLINLLQLHQPAQPVLIKFSQHE